MIKQIRKAEWFLFIMVLAAFILGAAFYPHLPASVASHWDTSGNVNGYMSRLWGDFLLPIIFLIVALALFFIPRIDPKRNNIEKFRKYYDYFIITFAIFIYYIYLLTLLWNTGYEFNFTTAFIPAIAASFYLIGLFLPHTEQNWFIGVRTPWTLSSVSVWKKTNELGGYGFRISALLMLFGIIVPTHALLFILVPIIITVLGVVVYSYAVYRKEQ